MFIYHHRVKNWFVYSCPGRVILISRTGAIYYISREHYRFGRIIQKRQIMFYEDVIKRKKPTLKYIIPVLGRIVDNRYQIISEYTTRFDNRDEVLLDWEKKVLVDVGFMNEQI